ncbi:glycerophosphodiester phosphodiesterase [Solicola gregarius]|uniref:GP-PDE domain-containing protein n=1 Tax=Solicola gregarius TaxID=2908642 RepID=A0AA46TLP6_9ACTN|nr:glycerophosphodiester phosphodiesterase family protein [Solicola gregarius]UYM06728.1 hypothetical protein L0C25_06560 [Solicola gregarius]
MYRSRRPDAARTVPTALGVLTLVVVLPTSSAGVAPDSTTAAGVSPTIASRSDDAVEKNKPPRIIAHRGASAKFPENTMLSFRKAINRGADWIEMDVQRTKDGRLVVFHDWSLRRTTNVEKVYPKLKSPSVGDLSYKKLRKLDAGKWKKKRFKGARIPPLKQVLRLGKKRDVKMLVELKNPGRYPGMMKKTLKLFNQLNLMKRGHKHDRVQLQSFKIRTMRHAAKHSPKVEIGLLYPDPPVTLKRLRWAQNINSYHREVERKYIRRAQKDYNIRVFVWTVNGNGGVKRAMRMNANGIITDRPKHTRKVVNRNKRFAPDELRIQLPPYDGTVPRHRA